MHSKEILDKCDCEVVHSEVVEFVQQEMPSHQVLIDLVNIYKILADMTRSRILIGLSKAEMCVCDIAVLLNMTQSAVSHQLKALYQARLVKKRKEGKFVFYSLKDQHIVELIQQTLDHVQEEAI